SSASTVSVLPRGTEQNPQGRVQTFPRIMNVAVRCDQHSVRFGHFALSHTVSSRRSSITPLVNDISADGNGRLSHRGSRRRSVSEGGGNVELQPPPAEAVDAALTIGRSSIGERLFGRNSDVDADAALRAAELGMPGVDVDRLVTERRRDVTD